MLMSQGSSDWLSNVKGYRELLKDGNVNLLSVRVVVEGVVFIVFWMVVVVFK
jgi:hypothetical protein